MCIRDSTYLKENPELARELEDKIRDHFFSRPEAVPGTAEAAAINDDADAPVADELDPEL